MNFEEKMKLLGDVRRACEKDPNMINEIVAAGTVGLQGAIANAEKRATDFEIIASSAISAMKGKRITDKTKEWFEGIIEHRLGKWKDKSSLNWDWFWK